MIDQAKALDERNVVQAMWRGTLCRCPHCGQGKMFRAYLKVADECTVCGEELSNHRADDFPPYIVVTIVGHLVLAGYMATELVLPLNSWQHLAIWAPITVISSLALLQPVKGAVIGLQWALKMHGFGGHGDAPEDVLPPRDERA